VGVGTEDVPPYTVPVKVACEPEITLVLGATAEIDDSLREVVALSTKALEVGTVDEVLICSEDVAGALEVEGAGASELEDRGVVEAGALVDAAGLELVEGSGVGDVESRVVAVLPESLDAPPVLADDADILKVFGMLHSSYEEEPPGVNEDV
jgi:hypothetical protein